MLAFVRAWFRGRGSASAARQVPAPSMPSDSLFDDLRHEAAAQRHAAGSTAPVIPRLSATLEQAIAETIKRDSAQGRSRR